MLSADLMAFAVPMMGWRRSLACSWYKDAFKGLYGKLCNASLPGLRTYATLSVHVLFGR